MFGERRSLEYLWDRMRGSLDISGKISEQIQECPLWVRDFVVEPWNTQRPRSGTKVGGWWRCQVWLRQEWWKHRAGVARTSGHD